MSTRNKIAVGIGVLTTIIAMLIYSLSAMSPESGIKMDQDMATILFAWVLFGITISLFLYRAKSDQYKRIKKKNRAIKIGIIIILTAILVLIMPDTQKDEGVTAVPVVILAGICSVLYGVSGRAIKTDEDMERVNRESEERQRILKNTIRCEHSYGLPLAVGTFCEVFKDDVNKVFKITGAGNTYTIAYDKITDISITSTTDSQYVSSIGGAIAGELLFGTLGAAVGGRVKQKKSIEFFLILTYMNKNDEVAYISMDIGSSGNLTCVEWKKEFKAKNKKEVEL